MEKKINKDNNNRTFIASTEEELKVLSSPQRQRIFKVLLSEGLPLHGKEIADRLGIKAASAHYHLKKMEEIGVVCESHTQVINGITARYYKTTFDSIVLGDDFLENTGDHLTNQKMQFIHSTFNSNRDAFLKSLEKQMCHTDDSINHADKLLFLLDFQIYLSENESEVFQSELKALFSKYEKPGPEKHLNSILLSVNSLSNFK